MQFRAQQKGLKLIWQLAQDVPVRLVGDLDYISILPDDMPLLAYLRDAAGQCMMESPAALRPSHF